MLFVYDLVYLSQRLRFLSGLNSSSALFSTPTLNINTFIADAFDVMFINSVINRTVTNYYTSDMFSRNSRVISLCAVKISILIFRAIKIKFLC